MKSIPKVLYKYIKKEYAKRLEVMGQLQISPLVFYKNEEKLGNQIGDNDEGKKSTRLQINNYVNNTEAKEHDFVNKFFKPATPDTAFQIKNLTLEYPEVDDRYYVYCLSTEYSTKLMEEFKSDCIITILNPILFIQSLTAKLGSEVEGDGLFVECIYGERERTYNQKKFQYDRIPPFALKSPSYAHQKEVRIVWKPKNPAHMKQNIKLIVPEVVQYCELKYF